MIDWTRSSSESATSLTPQTNARTRLSLSTWNVVLVIIWIAALVPFLFLRSEWFGRPLSDQQIGEYLHSNDNPKQIEGALSQIADRMARHDASIRIWYPDLLRLAKHSNPDIRALDARVLGQDPTKEEFHAALADMLHDHSRGVRFNAALALVRFGDNSGHDEIVAMLRPVPVPSPVAGQLAELLKPGYSVREGTVLARIKGADKTVEVESPVEGQVRSTLVGVGDSVPARTSIAVMQPSTENVIAALRALSQIGTPEDIPMIAEFQSPASPDRLRQQAITTERAIKASTAAREQRYQ